METTLLSTKLIADILSVSKSNIEARIKKGELIPFKKNLFHIKDLIKWDEFQSMYHSNFDLESKVTPSRPFKLIELFAGAGGLALGLERAGFDTIMLNEIDKHACETLRKNRPNWNVVEGDVASINFSPYKGKVDLLTGGFPCQAFSYAGKRLGFEDARGTLVFEFARAIKETQPKVFLAENVKALQTHDEGRTLETIKNIINDIGYTLVECSIYKAIFYKVPQKRERLIMIGVRNDLLKKAHFEKPSPYKRIMTMRDALKAGDLYEKNVPKSEGQEYPKRKKEILSHVPQGGYWRDLPIDLQKEYMQKSFFLGGGKTGMARRLSLDEPSLTLTCSPAQKQTERCHPLETRPLTTREYARVQTFPDDWFFSGSTTEIYKQIGNAVPVNMAEAIAKSIVRMLNEMEK